MGNNFNRGTILTFSFLLGTSVLWADTALLDKVKGTVEQQAPDAYEWGPAKIGDKLPEGTTLRTAKKSEAQLTLSQGHTFRLKAGTTFRLTRLQKEETLGRLEEGNVLSHVKKLSKTEKFGIQTPTAVCAVRGTVFETEVDKPDQTFVHVREGFVAVGLNSTGEERMVLAGQSLFIQGGTFELPPGAAGAGAHSNGVLGQIARHEVGLDMSRAEIIAAAADERRRADYEEGKSLVDINGDRVRLEEYIMRPRADQFKFVVLNERAHDRLDYFFYKGTFNKDLPTDLSLVLRDLSGKLGTTAPEYYLTDYEMAQSNTQDSLHDIASGGHLVKITRDDKTGDYVLTDNDSDAHKRTVDDAQDLGDGTVKIYNPLADSFSTVDAADADAAGQLAVYDPQNDSFRTLASGDTFWKTRFNNYTHAINNATKISYSPVTTGVNVLATTLDASYTYAGGFVLPVIETSANGVDATLTNFYGDGTFEKYRTVLIDDQGKIAPSDAFAGISTGAAYKDELLKWNYEQQVTATEFDGRKIDLVVEPKIFIKSGLIQ